MNIIKRHTRTSQRGATLVIGMIMLVLVTLFVLAAINMSTMNLRVMGNEQARNEALDAAQQAVEQVTSIDFTKDPANAPGVATPILVDIKGDGTAVYSVQVAGSPGAGAGPTCLNSVPIKLTELVATDPNDTPCFGSAASSSPGTVSAPGTGNSFCSSTQWEVNATVTDTTTGSGATLKLHQGVGKRVATGDSTC